jgi:hypothetical protein
MTVRFASFNVENLFARRSTSGQMANSSEAARPFGRDAHGPDEVGRHDLLSLNLTVTPVPGRGVRDLILEGNEVVTAPSEPPGMGRWYGPIPTRQWRSHLSPR